jgi:protein involved in polysaccharide export with SLBB domain
MIDRRSLLVPVAWACGALSGCTMFETAAPSSAQPTPLSWLTNWVSQPVEMVPGFDVESIKPVPGPVTVNPENLLEITVWDLYEPGKPYSYPVRVSHRHTIDVPFLGEVSVEGRSLQEIEGLLVDKFRRGDFLLNPRVLVRSLDSPAMKVHVTGAVSRAGFVELVRSDPSVYAAILAAGGLKKTSGTQVAVTRRAVTVPAGTAAPEIRSGGSAEADESGSAVSERAHPPALRANSVDELSVSQHTPAVRPHGISEISGCGVSWRTQPLARLERSGIRAAARHTTTASRQGEVDGRQCLVPGRTVYGRRRRSATGLLVCISRTGRGRLDDRHRRRTDRQDGRSHRRD